MTPPLVLLSVGPLLQSCSQLSLPASEREKKGSLPHPWVILFPLTIIIVNWVQVNQSGNYSFLKMWWRAADQEANCRQWLDHIRKWCGKDLVAIMCCNANRGEYTMTACSSQLRLCEKVERRRRKPKPEVSDRLVCLFVLWKTLSWYGCWSAAGGDGSASSLGPTIKQYWPTGVFPPYFLRKCLTAVI